MEQSFQDFGIDASILQGVTDVGYEQPTPIQREAIPLLIAGRDLLAQSQTGTGKTAAFAIPLLSRIEPANRAVQAIVLVPTRELAVQVASTVHKLGKHKNVADLPIYGGQPIDVQLRALRRGVQVVIGTPGRVMDHMRRGTLDLSHVSMVVLDEADQMLDMGFVDDIEVILDEVPEGRQISLFSATVPPRIRSLSQRYMNNPASISISKEHLTVPEVEQLYVETVRNGKLDALTRILDMEQPESALVFARTKRETDDLGESLSGRGYAAEVIHGDLSQAQRERAITAFKDGRIDVLVATDVAARGLDIPDVSHVINYDIPEDPEAYVHRIGRTARAGKTGKAITFVTPRERALLKTIERLIRVNLVRMKVPYSGRYCRTAGAGVPRFAARHPGGKSPGALLAHGGATRGRVRRRTDRRSRDQAGAGRADRRRGRGRWTQYRTGHGAPFRARRTEGRCICQGLRRRHCQRSGHTRARDWGHRRLRQI